MVFNNDPSENLGGNTGRPTRILMLILGSIILGAIISYLIYELVHRAQYTDEGIRIRDVSIVSFSPTGKVPMRTNFTFEFSDDIVDEEELGIEHDELPVKFIPPIPGRFKWIAPHKLRFYPLDPLLPATPYEVKILPRDKSERRTSPGR